MLWMEISWQFFITTLITPHRIGKKISKSSRGWEVCGFGTKWIDTALFNIYLSERKWRDKLYLYGGIPRDKGRRLFGTTKICIPCCFSHFFKLIIRGAVLFWMTVYPWLIKPKHNIKALYYQLALESQNSSDKPITLNPWRVQMRATKTCTCNGEP